MWQQIQPKPFEYTEEYLSKQGTTVEMSWLRIGYLLAYLGAAPWGLSCLELGPGTGVFYETIKPLVHEMHGYDVAPSKYSTVSLEEVRSRKWDILFAFDVIEHMPNIDDIWDIDFRFGYLSYPERPSAMTAEYRHLKPDEHIWHMQKHEVRDWAWDHGYGLAIDGNPEDAIRLPWSFTEHNIASTIIYRNDSA